MSVIEAIKQRNSNAFMSDREVPEQLIREILDAAVCTPAHYRTNPWRFLVIRGAGRNRFGDFMADRLIPGMEDPASPENVAYLNKIRKKPLRAPVIIAAGAAKSLDCPKALMVEDVAAVSAACQNILLAADALGLSAIWRTGSLAYDRDTVAFLGFAPDTELVGFVYLGYAAKNMPPKPRESAAQFTRWMD